MFTEVVLTSKVGQENFKIGIDIPNGVCYTINVDEEGQLEKRSRKLAM